jgi:hypothetical protein
MVPRKKLKMGSGFKSTLWCPGERGKGWKVQPRLPRVGCGGRRENGAGEEVVRRKWSGGRRRRLAATPIILFWNRIFISRVRACKPRSAAQMVIRGQWPWLRLVSSGCEASMRLVSGGCEAGTRLVNCGWWGG